MTKLIDCFLKFQKFQFGVQHHSLFLRVLMKSTGNKS